MKSLPALIFLLLAGLFLQGQTTEKPVQGTVSYVTSQHVYVKFESTDRISQGDTLFIRRGDDLIPVLRVENLSSISCVCAPLGSVIVAVSDAVLFQPRMASETSPALQTILSPVVPAPEKPQAPDSLSGKSTPEKAKRQDLYGFIAAATYADFSGTTAGNSLKMKYTLSVNMRNIGNSNVSFESYINFVHRDKEWSEIQRDIFNGLKIYNLSVSYRFLKHYSLLLGRRINPRLSNMGAVDGLQFEMNFKPFTVGILAGYRPDPLDYGFNFNMLQFGAFVSHDKATKNGYLQSTLAFVQQMDSGKVDRRFIYLQHTNSVVRNLTFFGSAELDFFGLTLNPEDSTYLTDNSPKLTNLYLSLTYRLLRKADISFSYSARKNVIYYESHKSYLDQLLDQETRQGYSLRLNYRPISHLSIGASGGYRFQKQDPKPSKNIYAYVSYSQIPGIRLAATVSFTYLETSYLTGKIYGVGLSRDFFKGKLYTGLGYRYVDYRMYNSEIALPQHVGSVDLTWRIVRRLALSLFYEGTFQDIDQFNRIYAQLQLRL